MLTPDHTDACIAARRKPRHGRNDETPDWPQVGLLTPAELESVLACPHSAHDSTRLFFKRTS